MSAAIDSLGFAAAARRLPEVTEAALASAGEVALPELDRPDAVVLLGTGPARWAADAVAAVGAAGSPVPVVVAEEGQPPAFVGERTLVVAVALHDRSRTTADAAAAAAAAGATVIVVAGGEGPLAGAGAGWATTVPLDASPPHARCAPGALVGAPLVVLDRLGLAPGAQVALDQALTQLRARRDEAAAGRAPVLELARRVGRSIPLVVGAGPVGRLAARWWKLQCNTNAKIPAFTSALPDAAHDEISGWGQHGDVTRQVIVGLVLRHQGETPSQSAAMGPLVAALEESLLGVHEVPAGGAGPLAELLDLAYLGGLVSLELAAREGLDPGPAPALELLAP